MVSIMFMSLVIPAFPCWCYESASTLDRYYSSLWYSSCVCTTEEGVRRHYRFFRRASPPFIVLVCAIQWHTKGFPTIFPEMQVFKKWKDVTVSKSSSIEYNFTFPSVFVGRNVWCGNWRWIVPQRSLLLWMGGSWTGTTSLCGLYPLWVYEVVRLWRLLRRGQHTLDTTYFFPSLHCFHVRKTFLILFTFLEN